MQMSAKRPASAEAEHVTKEAKRAYADDDAVNAAISAHKDVGSAASPAIGDGGSAARLAQKEGSKARPANQTHAGAGSVVVYDVAIANPAGQVEAPRKRGRKTRDTNIKNSSQFGVSQANRLPRLVTTSPGTDSTDKHKRGETN